ncbi:MAG: FAD-binding oxidoreductase [Sediminimonas qiaohouensis]|uniref:FAD-binding oxidoreductase n=1 Tax=Sediminimonas qiaohouensis TaxID=552061 RepID=A0A7C9LAV6_9RHOB|nr:FAD-binding oxidoreductase [Sediminimonas qiaohouensis]MTJ04537.1 FAD-binding oxidoreductase [Sediminimonas qiaohouensis]
MTPCEHVPTLLPTEIVVRDQDIIGGYTTDFRKKYVGQSPALLRPRSTEEVAEIVKLCSRHGVALVPVGGNTGYCGGATPDGSGQQLLISLQRMNKVREIDADNLSITVDAGCILSDIHKAAAEESLMFPLSLGSQQSCQIGGNISTNAGGVSALRYGITRDLVLGLEVVLPDGQILSNLSPLRKDNRGYALHQLLIGAEGSLGIVTGASMRLFLPPISRVTGFLAIREISDLMPLLAKAQQYTGEAVTSFEYISDTSLELLLAKKPELRRPIADPSSHYVLIEAVTSSPILPLDHAMEAFFEDGMSEELVTDGVIAASEQQRNDFWNLREHIPEGEVLNGGSVKHDVSVRSSDMGRFIEMGSSLVERYGGGARLSIYGHVGDGNVHFNVLAPQGVDASAFLEKVSTEVSPRIYDLVAKMEGSFSAEYGLGQDKMPLNKHYGDPIKRDLMNALKTVFDPQKIMNPGKVVPTRIETASEKEVSCL